MKMATAATYETARLNSTLRSENSNYGFSIIWNYTKQRIDKIKAYKCQKSPTHKK